MTEEKPFTGRCACGRVQYRCHRAPLFAAHCQCRDCRWETGAGHSSHVGAPADATMIEGELRYWETPADSGALSRRGFCPTCGSSIVFTSSSFPDVIFLSAGSLDDPTVFRPSMVVFAASAPAWDIIDPALARFPGMPQR